MTQVTMTARRLYDALSARDGDAILSALSDDFVGEVSAGMPLAVGGRHEGPDAMLRDVWGRIFAAYDMHVEVERYLPSGDDAVVVLGAYRGTERATGRPVDARFAHILSVRDDRVTALRQITDTRRWTGSGPQCAPAATATDVVTLDTLLAVTDFRERHERRVAAPPSAVWAALHELQLGDVMLSRALMGLRTLPARLAARERSRRTGARLLDHTPIPLLAADPHRALVAGGVLQPWKLLGGAEPPRLDAQALRDFDEPGWLKCATDFRLEPDGDGTRLSTETRVQATDPRTRVRFTPYWLLIRPGSGLIRRDLLRAAAHRAEADAPRRAPQGALGAT